MVTPISPSRRPGCRSELAVELLHTPLQRDPAERVSTARMAKLEFFAPMDMRKLLDGDARRAERTLEWSENQEIDSYGKRRPATTVDEPAIPKRPQTAGGIVAAGLGADRAVSSSPADSSIALFGLRVCPSSSSTTGAKCIGRTLARVNKWPRRVLVAGAVPSGASEFQSGVTFAIRPRLRLPCSRARSLRACRTSTWRARARSRS